MSEENKTYGHIKSFVLRQARMTRAQEVALEKIGPRFKVDFSENELNFHELFGNNNPVILEIGFGMGHATAEIARANPDKNYLCVEVHGPGVGALLIRIEDADIQNIRIIQHDVVLVLRHMIPKNSLSGVHIFFPDPWPKKRHHKRRLIQIEFLKSLLRYLAARSYIYVATDWEDYAQEILHAFRSVEELNLVNDGFSPRQEWRPETSFEHKGLDKSHLIREILGRFQ